MINSYFFKRKEFKCPCCKFNVVDTELLDILEEVREQFDKPVRIETNCSYKGSAADITVDDISAKEVFDFLGLKYKRLYVFIHYINENIVHIDSVGKTTRKTSLSRMV